MLPKGTICVCSILLVVLAVGAYLFVSSTQPKMFFSVSDFAGICVHSLSAQEAQIVRESGAGWVRVDVSPNFGDAARNAKAQNLRVLGILGSWMFNQSVVFTLEEWRANVTWYVSEYADFTDAWEIWNEPASLMYPVLGLNVSHPENLTTVAEFYFLMAQTAYPIIRQHDPSAKIVLLGGLNLWSGGAINLDLDMQFARQLVGMGILQYGNAISVHAYPWAEQVAPDVWEKYGDSLAYYRGLFPQNSSMEVWATETGHPVDFSGEDAQAQYMSGALEYFEGKVTRVFWYSLLDYSADGHSFGLVANGTMRPAYHVLQEQMRADWKP